MKFEDYLSENWRHEHPDSVRSQARRARERNETIKPRIMNQVEQEPREKASAAHTEVINYLKANRLFMKVPSGTNEDNIDFLREKENTIVELLKKKKFKLKNTAGKIQTYSNGKTEVMIIQPFDFFTPVGSMRITTKP